MSRVVENSKENKKQKGKEQPKPPPKPQWKAENPKKLPEGAPLKMCRSPKLKKKVSKDQVTSEQISETVEITGYDDEKTESMVLPPTINPSKSALPMPITVIETAPPTHYMSVSVALALPDTASFLYNVVINSNMVIIKVPICFMTDFMPGDQISGVNEKSVWDTDDLRQELTDAKCAVEITLIRVWNIKCLSRDQLDRIAPLIEVGRQYFVVKIYCDSGMGGLRLGATRKSVTVQDVRVKTPVSKVLLAGDEIIAVDNQVPVGRNKKVVIAQAYKLVSAAIQDKGYAEIIASRRVGARSSPAPSLEAELGEQFADYAVGVPKGEKVVRTGPEKLGSLPFAADASEIALRELTFLRQWVKPDLECHPCEKGDSMLVELVSKPTKSRMLPVSSTSPLNPSPCNSTAYTPRDSQALPPTSMAQPVTEQSVGVSVMKNAVLATPQPPSASQKSMKMGEGTILDTYKVKTANITSDIPEEEDLKKCHERAGIVSFIKNKVSNSKPVAYVPPNCDNQVNDKKK